MTRKRSRDEAGDDKTVNRHKLRKSRKVAVEDDRHWDVQKIVSHRHLKDGTLIFVVKWKGYSKVTSEPIESFTGLDSMDLVVDYCNAFDRRHADTGTSLREEIGMGRRRPDSVDEVISSSSPSTTVKVGSDKGNMHSGLLITPSDQNTCGPSEEEDAVTFRDKDNIAQDVHSMPTRRQEQEELTTVSSDSSVHSPVNPFRHDKDKDKKRKPIFGTAWLHTARSKLRTYARPSVAPVE